MSESSSIVIFSPPHGNEQDAPAEDQRQYQEQELQKILRRLTTEMSALARVKALPLAKALYEALHPETRHGGDHRPPRQRPKSGSWPCFADHVASTCGISRAAVYTQLSFAKQLVALTPDAETAATATSLSNQLGVLARIAAIPDPAIQQDLALRYSGERGQVKKDLRDREREFGLAPPSRRSRKAPEPIDAGHDPNQSSESASTGSAGDAGSAGAGNRAALLRGECSGSSDETSARDAGFAAIEVVLGASTITDCLDAIRRLQTEGAEVDALRGRLSRAEEKCAGLERALALYEQAPLGELFTILGVTTVHDALAQARSMLGVSNAAE